MTELAIARDVDEDDVAEEDRIPDEADAGTDANGRQESAALTALRTLGPATASEIARHTQNPASANVATRLRQLEKIGKVRRTGRMVNPEGQRGGPQVEWEIMADGAASTAPTDALSGTGPVEDRIRRLAERVATANGRAEAIQNELDATKARAERLEHTAREAERRRQEAERRLQAAGTATEDLATATERAKRALEQSVRLDEELRAARDRIRTLEAQPAQPAASSEELTAAKARAADLLRALNTAGERIAELEARVAQKAEGGGIPGGDMRDRYFALLLKQAEVDGASEHVYDRIERLIDGGADE